MFQLNNIFLLGAHCALRVLWSAMHADGGVIHILMKFSIDSHLHVFDIQIENQRSHDRALRYSKIDVASIRNFVVNLNKMLSSIQVVDGPFKILF